MAKRVIDRIRNILWQWDPIGVADDREMIPDEYEFLVAAVMRGAKTGKSGIAAELNREINDLGITASSSEDVAQELFDAFGRDI